MFYYTHRISRNGTEWFPSDLDERRYGIMFKISLCQYINRFYELLERMNRIQIHFDGDIAINHQVSMRTLGRTISHLQSALDRAYIENKYGSLWKHARMRAADYEESMFLVQEPKEGGYVLDFLASNTVTRGIVDRIDSAITSALKQSMHQGEENAQTLGQQINTRKMQIEKGIIKPSSFNQLIENPSKDIVRSYGDRSITKEIDQILAIIRSKYSGNSTFELVTYGSKSNKYLFNRNVSEKFHKVVSKRSLGEPVVYVAKVLSLDFKNHSGKIKNVFNGKDANIHFFDDASFLKAKSYLGTDDEMTFVGCPLIEYGAFDPQAGDIHFIDLI